MAIFSLFCLKLKAELQTSINQTFNLFIQDCGQKGCTLNGRWVEIRSLGLARFSIGCTKETVVAETTAG